MAHKLPHLSEDWKFRLLGKLKIFTEKEYIDANGA